MVNKYAPKKTVYLFKEAKHLHTNSFCLAAECYSVSENTEEKKSFAPSPSKQTGACLVSPDEHSLAGGVKTFLFLSVNTLHMHLLCVCTK